eukprot:TRINITY_DN773_c1_g1_i3.p3 TRINITY_DN773_c1_g1~~TRINITY_DN773_c1_g1_i3.p3  ORF type:complete len:136 (+),score=16.01 TRINITY_DN773_c1_g1_i3:283-690(+)
MHVGPGLQAVPQFTSQHAVADRGGCSPVCTQAPFVPSQCIAGNRKCVLLGRTAKQGSWKRTLFNLDLRREERALPLWDWLYSMGFEKEDNRGAKYHCDTQQRLEAKHAISRIWGSLNSNQAFELPPTTSLVLFHW